MGDGVNVAQRGSERPLRWSVRKRRGRWMILDAAGVWHDSAASLAEAVSEATRYAVCDEVWAADGLARLSRLVDDANCLHTLARTLATGFGG